MNHPSIRIQLIASAEDITAIEQVAQSDSIQTERHSLPITDQRFGLAEVAAIVAVVHTVAQVAELLAKAWATVRSKTKVTLKTPKGTVTIEGDNTTTVEAIMKQIQQQPIF